MPVAKEVAKVVEGGSFVSRTARKAFAGIKRLISAVGGNFNDQVWRQIPLSVKLLVGGSIAASLVWGSSI